MREHIKNAWEYIVETIRNWKQWFWPMWAVVTIFVSSLGFFKSEHAVNAVEQEVIDRSEADASSTEDRQRDVCEQAKQNMIAQEEKDKALLTGLIVDIINAGDGTPEEKQRDTELIIRIVDLRVTAEYDKLPEPASCIDFMKHYGTVAVPE